MAYLKKIEDERNNTCKILEEKFNQKLPGSTEALLQYLKAESDYYKKARLDAKADLEGRIRGREVEVKNVKEYFNTYKQIIDQKFGNDLVRKLEMTPKRIKHFQDWKVHTEKLLKENDISHQELLKKFKENNMDSYRDLHLRLLYEQDNHR